MVEILTVGLVASDRIEIIKQCLFIAYFIVYLCSLRVFHNFSDSEIKYRTAVKYGICQLIKKFLQKPHQIGLQMSV